MQRVDASRCTARSLNNQIRLRWSRKALKKGWATCSNLNWYFNLRFRGHSHDFDGFTASSATVVENVESKQRRRWKKNVLFDQRRQECYDISSLSSVLLIIENSKELSSAKDWTIVVFCSLDESGTIGNLSSIRRRNGFVHEKRKRKENANKSHWSHSC